MHSSETGSNNGSRSTGADSLRDRFLALWRRCLSPGAADHSKAVWDAMAARYTEAHRYYHDEQHLAHCFEQLELARDQTSLPDAVEMALWFHDVINDPGNVDNETRSAAFFRHCGQGVMDDAFVAAVIDLILATTHREEPKDLDQQFICDIDLASFGRDWERYKRDTDKLKAEHLGSEDDYYRNKRAFLSAMLSKPRIFYSDFFHARYEQQARDNILRLLGLFDQQQD